MQRIPIKKVVRTFVHEKKEIVHIKVNGEEITTTDEHPFYVPEKGWTVAAELRAGDQLKLLNGEIVIIEQIQHELLENPIFVYNFEVEDFRTYYVSESGILVHNACSAVTKGAGNSLDNARALGKAGEQASGITKNTRHIESITGTAKYRIPDGLDAKNLIEVKNVRYQGYTNQIKDFHLYSKANNLDFTLYTRRNTTISGPLQELINNGDIIHRFLP